MNETRWLNGILGGSLAVLLLAAGMLFSSGANPAAAAPQSPQANPQGPTTAKMTSATAQKEPPTEAVKEIDLRVIGGGYPGCLSALSAPEINYKIDNLDLTGITLIATCGWLPDETVKITLMDPRGDFFYSEARATPSKNRKDIYQVTITFQPGVDAPTGKYRFTLQGSAMLKTAVFFNKPVGAKLYAVSQDRFQPTFKAMGGQHRLRLEGFLPGESVRLFAYRFESSIAKFYAWQDFTTDRKGDLVVETDFPEISSDIEMNFSAFGKETHSVHMERFSPDGVRINRQFDMDLYCPGALAPRLADTRKIQLVSDARPELHYQPGFGSRVTAMIPPDSQIRVFDYPKCIDRAYWWKVSISQPVLFGWVAESYMGKYQVEPVR